VGGPIEVGGASVSIPRKIEFVSREISRRIRCKSSPGELDKHNYLASIRWRANVFSWPSARHGRAYPHDGPTALHFSTPLLTKMDRRRATAGRLGHRHLDPSDPSQGPLTFPTTFVSRLRRKFNIINVVPIVNQICSKHKGSSINYADTQEEEEL